MKMTAEQRHKRKLFEEAIQAVLEKKRKYASYPSSLAQGFPWAKNGAQHYNTLAEVLALLEKLRDEV